MNTPTPQPAPQATPAPAAGPPSGAIPLTGRQKAALLIIQLGSERASKVLQTMREDEVAALASEVAKMPTVGVDTVADTWRQFRELATASYALARGGLDYARALLEDTLGPTQASRILDQLTAAYSNNPFEFLAVADARQVASFLADEHPQTIALVLAHLAPDRASTILVTLPEALQAQVAARIATMDATTPATLEKVEAVVARRFATSVPVAETRQAGGVQALVDILNRSDRATERRVLDGLDADDPDMAAEVRDKLFVFEDVVALDDRSVQMVLREVKMSELAVALKGVTGAVQAKITKNLSERATENLMEEIEDMGKVRLKDVEEAQNKVVRIIRDLEEKGEIVISRGGEDEFVI